MVLAGLFACLAFMTRNSNLFLYPAALFGILFMGCGLKNAGIFLGSSLAFGLPWYIPNMIANGTPYPQAGLFVLKFAYTHISPEKLASINSLTGLILLDPVFFIKHTLSNIGVYLYRDMTELIHPVFGICILICIAIMIAKRIKFTRIQWALFMFPAAHFLFLTLIHYNIRFAFFRIPFYAILLFVPFFNRKGRNKNELFT